MIRDELTSGMLHCDANAMGRGCAHDDVRAYIFNLRHAVDLLLVDDGAKMQYRVRETMPNERMDLAPRGACVAKRPLRGGSVAHQLRLGLPYDIEQRRFL